MCRIRTVRLKNQYMLGLWMSATSLVTEGGEQHVATFFRQVTLRFGDAWVRMEPSTSETA